MEEVKEDLATQIGSVTLRGIADPMPVASVLGDEVVAVRSDYRVVAKRVEQAGHRFHDIVSFARWLNRAHDEEESKVDILCDGDAIQAWVPGQAVRTCEMRHSPMFKRWLALLNKPQNYKALINSLREVEETIDTGVLSVLLGQLHKLKVVKGSEVEVRTGANGNTEFVSKTGSANVEGTLPRSLPVNCVVYAHADAARYLFSVDINMNTDGDLPTFTLAAPTLVTTLEVARQDAIADFEKILSPRFLVGYGSIGLAVVPMFDETKAQFAPPSGGCIKHNT